MSASSIADNLARIRRCIDDACRKADRSPDDVTLVAVSKRQPLELLKAAFDAGQRIFGENQVQEAAGKIPELPGNLEWHLIGPLQSNKVKIAAGLFHTFHSVDREKIARGLSKECACSGRCPDVFFQINVGSEPSKHGFDERDIAALRPLLTLPSLRPVGLMAIPPFEDDPEDSRRWFRRLRELRDEVTSWPEADEFPGFLSMGMSHDFRIAIEEGATHIRVGTDIFGSRSD